MAVVARLATMFPTLMPFLRWTPMVSRETLMADLLAGLTGAVVVLPQGVAFATIAGMPPEYGLYAGMLPAIVAALFGSSWHLVSGPSTAASLVLFSSLSVLAEPGTATYVHMALTVALMVGLMQVTMALFRMGTVVNFISHSVVIGFTAAAGVLIAINQIKNFFALPIPRGAHTYDVIAYFLTHFADVSIPAASAGAATLVTGILSRRFLPTFPYMIPAIVAGSVVAWFFNHWSPGSVATMGALPASLPPLSMPSLDPDMWRRLAPVSVAMTLFALTEALSIARALAVKSGQHIDANQEFFAQGLSNLTGAFFSGYVATGSFNRSGMNWEAGARTPLAAMLSGIFLMGAVLVVAPYTHLLPYPAMAGVLFLVAWGLIDKHHIAQILRTSRSEAAVLIVVFVVALLAELELAIFLGVMLSLLLYLNRTANPKIVPRVPDPMSGGRKFTNADAAHPECPQLRIARMDGSLFFGAVSTFQEALRAWETEKPFRRHLAIVMSGVNFVDIAGAEALVQMAERRLKLGGGLYLIRVKDQVHDFLDRGGYLDQIGRKNIFVSKTEALRTLYRLFDYEECRSCHLRVWVECVRMGKQEPLEEDFDDDIVTIENCPAEWAATGATAPPKPT